MSLGVRWFVGLVGQPPRVPYSLGLRFSARSAEEHQKAHKAVGFDDAPHATKTSVAGAKRLS